VLVFGSEAIRATIGEGLVREKLTPNHGARWGFAWQLPDLTSPPDAPLWTDYLGGMFGGEAEGCADTDERIAYLETWAGLALLGLAPRLQLPALILCGERGTGKTTLADLLADLYPSGAVSNVEPQQWGSTDAAGYHLASLEGKLLNKVNDLDLSAPITDAATLKKVIFGEAVNARQIRGIPVNFNPRAAHFWCGNGLPKVVGADAALWDRMLPLVVSGPPWRGAPGEERDLGEKLRGELPNIVARLLWRAQAALERVARGERLLEPPPSSRARLASWRDTADSVALWRSERLTYDAALPATRSITRAAAWQDYQSWCMDTRHQSCSQHEWARRLEAQGIKIKRAGHGGVVLERHNLSAE
jgi:phage/plasmid-associated DNA primase